MRKTMPLAGALLIAALLWVAGKVYAQEAKPFEDVKPDHWAYQAVTDLHMKGIVSGYPDGHFNGQRTLTRYEFAVAVKRAVDRLPGTRPSAARQEAPAPAPASTMLTSVEVTELRKLTVAFKDELVSLGVDMAEVTARLDRATKSAANVSPRITNIVSPGDGFAIGLRPGSSGGASSASGILGGASTIFDHSRGVLSGHGFDISSRAGGLKTAHFSGTLDPMLGGGSGRSFLAPGISAGGFSPAHRSMPPALNFSIAPGSSFLLGGGASTRVSGFHSDVALGHSGELGITYLDYSSGVDSGPGSGLFAPTGPDLALYGANVRVNAGGRFAFGGEASKSVSQQRFADSGDDNNAFLLHLKYNSGPVVGSAGYQYYDPSFTAPNNWNGLGSIVNPANLQGPYARVGGRFNNLQADLGVDYLTAARNRPGYGGFTQGSSAVRGLAGIGYRSKQFELTANYEGVLYDLSGAISATGVRSKPVEQYITLGAGLNLTGNTVLRLAYQIINVQDASNGFGLAPGFGGSAAGASASTSVFTTQFAIHF